MLTRTASGSGRTAELSGAGAPLGRVAGTRVLAEPGLDHYAVVLRDPEGNEFCVN